MRYISATSTESYNDAIMKCLDKIFGILSGSSTPLTDHRYTFGEIILTWSIEGSSVLINARKYEVGTEFFKFTANNSFIYDRSNSESYYAETYLFGDMTQGSKWFKFSPKRQNSAASDNNQDTGFCGISITEIGDVVFNSGSGREPRNNFGYLDDGNGKSAHYAETYILSLTPIFSVNYGFADAETSSGVVMIPYLPNGCLKSSGVVDTKLYLLQTNTMIATRSCGALYLNGRPMVIINPIGIFGTLQGLGILAGEDKIGA